jgi:hypothetical protein
MKLRHGGGLAYGQLRRCSACCAAVLACGCAATPALDLFDKSQATAESQTLPDERAWEDVVRDYVREGLVDYAGLARDPGRLNDYLVSIAAAGPRSTPEQFADGDARLAYYINAYNACVLRAVLARGVPKTIHEAARPLELSYRFQVDGETVTLAELHERVRQESGDDARSELALCGAALGSPPLADQPYRSFNIRKRLRAATRAASANPRLVFVDHERATLLLGPAFWASRERFARTYMREMHTDGATTLNWLMHVAEPAKRGYIAGAVGNAEKPIPFDGALNMWTPPPKE